MTEHDEPRRFSKTVAIKATDDEEMTATGVVLTPYELDRQLDWLDPDGIEAMFNPSPSDGVMHAAFPDDHADLERNEVLEEPETIDGVEFDAGEWVIRRSYSNADRWELVKNGVLSAYSIGGNVTNTVEYDSVDEIPDEVDTSKVDPDTVPDKYWPPEKIVNGAVDEISDVDIGAVPSSDMAVVKSIGKNVLEQTNGHDEFVQLIQQRNPDVSEDGAEQLYDYLTEQSDKIKMGKETDTPGDDPGGHDSDLSDVDDATLGKRLKRLLFGGDGADGGNPDDGVDEKQTPEVPAGAMKALTIAKEGRTLNSQNREALMAAHDAIESSLASEVDFETNRFTDNDDVDFNVAQYGDKPDDDDEKAAPLEKLTEEQGDLVTGAIQRFVDNQGEAPFGDFRSWVWQTDILDDDTAFAAEEAGWEYEDYVREQRDETAVTEDFAGWVASESNTDTEITMSDDNPDTEDAPEWAKSLTDRIDSIEQKLSDTDNEDGAEKADDGEDAPGWAQDLTSKVDDLDERVDKVAAEKAESDQVGGEGGDAEDGTSDESKAFLKALGGAN